MYKYGCPVVEVNQFTMALSTVNLKDLVCKSMVDYAVDSDEHYPNLNVNLQNIKEIFPTLQLFGNTHDARIRFALLQSPLIMKDEVLLFHARFKGTYLIIVCFSRNS